MSVKEQTAAPAIITDLRFFDYNKRQIYEISAERNMERAQSAAASGHFQFTDGRWVENEYEGFAVVSMLNDNEGNDYLFGKLVDIQVELKDNLQPQNGFYMLPPESFHQTVVNTLSDTRFKQHIVSAGLEVQYPQLVQNAFNNIPLANAEKAVRMRMMGLSIFGTAIGMLGIFDNQDNYNRVTRFRSAFYADSELANLDVRMTRPFIGHITLAYIESSLNRNQKNHLADVVNEINAGIEKQELYFNITKTGLRRYYHLAEFIKEDNYPVHNL